MVIILACRIDMSNERCLLKVVVVWLLAQISDVYLVPSSILLTFILIIRIEI